MLFMDFTIVQFMDRTRPCRLQNLQANLLIAKLFSRFPYLCLGPSLEEAASM